MQKIHNYIFKFKKYLEYTLETINYHRLKTDKLTKYKHFNEDLDENTRILISLHNELSKITPFKFSLSKINEIGHIMYCFYQLYNNPIYNNAILYSFGFNGYFSIMYNLATNISENKIVKTTFVSEGKPVFKKMYYPKFINEEKQKIVKNNCNLNKNMIITGPNASGKTTTLKTALINIILSQQIGFGCFDSLKLKPYDNLHCYLNIPDTSGRDSLFQAEARRCKEIIDCIDENTSKGLTHFCIFDELYSGTNPEEAVVSANAFMEYIVKNPNVTCILTTHYTKLCKKLSKNKMIKNFNMKTLKKNDNFEYTYELEEGISKVKGGLKVLHDMKYPKEILDLTQSKIL
jgi:DNA mismatch repair ATPase MutS